ncbi:hypothetical protein LEMLEM_LOCUS10255, partial [Lemmus lemmus]
MNPDKPFLSPVVLSEQVTIAQFRTSEYTALLPETHG